MALEGYSQEWLDGTEEIMSERVAIRQVRILPTENLRFPGEGSSAQGQSVPKARSKGVADGKQVEYSCTGRIALYLWGDAVVKGQSRVGLRGPSP